ncbi:MAG TPA: hypothetical protein VG778_00220 [Blastocatellia bacterium]|jgi:cytochrome c553|nr:hypothetical protein [Blastocatellia bacterium]
MNKKDIYFVGLLVLVLGVFMTLWLISRKPPAMSGRAEHIGVTRETRRESCFECHGPDQAAPLPPHHPKKGLPDETKGRPNATPTPCAECHKLPPPAVAAFDIPGVRKGRPQWQNPWLE